MILQTKDIKYIQLKLSTEKKVCLNIDILVSQLISKLLYVLDYVLCCGAHLLML